VQKTAVEVEQLIEQLATQGEAMVRVIGVLAPPTAAGGNAIHQQRGSGHTGIRSDHQPR
jgi:hypothetical protein